MKVEFGKLPLHSEIIITAENHNEAEQLQQWNNCVLSAKYDFKHDEKPCDSSLQIIREL